MPSLDVPVADHRPHRAGAGGSQLFSWALLILRLCSDDQRSCLRSQQSRQIEMLLATKQHASGGKVSLEIPLGIKARAFPSGRVSSLNDPALTAGRASF